MRFACHWLTGPAIAVLGVVAASVAPKTLPAQQPDRRGGQDTITVYVLDSLTVRGRVVDLVGVATTASAGFVGFRDLRLRPLQREGELLETVPGMILTQHSGSGKSNQMFVRGFNLDHGTDFSTRIEGMPVNIPSHAHGQGYTDLNFVIPELVDHVEYSLGSYYAEIGDFSSAGGAHLRLRSSLDQPLFVGGIGDDGYQRLVAATQAPVGGSGSLLLGGEYKGFDGPWERPEDLKKLSGMVRYDWRGRTSSLSLLALGYDSRWNASDQIPLRGVESGLLSRFGQVDPTLGGSTSRGSLSGMWTRSVGSSSQRFGAYAINYDLELFSNFTYLLDDSTAGDQIRQRDNDRWTLGLTGMHRQDVVLGGTDHVLTVGAQLRADRAEVSLARTSRREPVSIVRMDEVSQWSAGPYAELASAWSPVVRSTIGLRGDLYSFDVTEGSGQARSAQDAILSPKASLVFGPWSSTELYLSGGLGFHSNDARVAVGLTGGGNGSGTTPANPLVRSRGAEVGLRASMANGLRSTLALWGVRLASELVFLGDAGTTEAVGPSRRVGVTFANFYRVRPTWIADFDVSVTRARFESAQGGGTRIPNALENVVAAGISHEPLNDGLFGALRVRRFGSYPLIEDNSSRANANALLNLNLGYRLGAARLTVSVLNLLDEEHSDIQYFYGSRLGGEPAGGVEDLHFHPAEPRQVRVGLSWGT